MDLDLKGKVTLVTGADGQIGFGKIIALTLAQDGCDLVTNNNNAKRAEKGRRD